MQQNLILASSTGQEAYEKSCAALGEQPKTLEQFNTFFGERTGGWEFSQHRITTVIEAVKEGKKCDYTNNRQYKHYPWFSAGSGFSLGAVVFGRTRTTVGARLSSLDEETAERIAELFLEDYRKWAIE